MILYGVQPMKVTVEFLSLPLITQPLGKKKIDIEFHGSTLSDLAGELSSKINRVKDVLLASDGIIDNDIQVYINGAVQVQREEIESKKLSEGDTVTFMLLVAGG
jgi:molybdopterin converting factor small subunit